MYKSRLFLKYRGGIMMEHILRPIYQERASDPNTLGAILVEKLDDISPTTDNIDSILLILVSDAKKPVFTKHYTYEQKHAAMHIVTEKQLRKWLLLGTNKKIISWLVDGRVIFDRNEFVSSLREEMKNTKDEGRNIKMGIEFAKLIRRYQEAKVSFDQKDYLDGMIQTMESLTHLARLSIIEAGVYPETKVWEQVRFYNAQIYDLYESFIMSTEELYDRIENAFQAIDSLIEAYREECSKHIVGVMSGRERWTIQQLHEQEEIKNYSINLEVFIEYLIEKGYIDIERVATKSLHVDHRYYRV